MRKTAMLIGLGVFGVIGILCTVCMIFGLGADDIAFVLGAISFLSFALTLATGMEVDKEDTDE